VEEDSGRGILIFDGLFLFNAEEVRWTLVTVKGGDSRSKVEEAQPLKHPAVSLLSDPELKWNRKKGSKDEMVGRG